MTDEFDSQRVSRLAGVADSTGALVDDGGKRLVTPPEKAKRREMPRSYSTFRVTDEEKLWAAIAHGSIWITLLTSVVTVGALIPVSVFVPLVIYFMFRRKSDFVAFHALQAFVLQLIGTVGAVLLLTVGGVVWVIGLVVSLLAMIILIGFILLPVWGLVGVLLLLVTVLMPPAALLLGTLAAIETYNGRDYRFPFIARMIDRQLAGGFLNAA